MIRRYAAYAAVALAAGGFVPIVWFGWTAAGPSMEDLVGSLAVVGLVGIGVLVLLRRPENPLGPLFTVCGVLWALTEAAMSYAALGLAGGAWAAAFGSWASDLAWGAGVTFGFLLFPNGRLPSPRWRPVAWTAFAVLALLALLSPFVPGPLSQAPSVENPLGTDRLGPVLWLEEWVEVLLLLCVVASFASVFVRYWSESAVERQQIKGPAYVAALLALDVLFSGLAPLVVRRDSPIVEVLNFAGALLFALFLVSVGVAILRYRLFDVDLLINRTLVYATLSAALAGVYLGGVATMQWLFRAASGGESGLAIVASTLAIAALFSPLRRRVQAFVDRLFYRGRYDAAKTLASFSARLRDETDLDRLGDELVGVVRGTLRPEHASLWLRERASGGPPETST